MTIGSQVKVWRESAGLSQRELAERIGVTQAAVGNYESERTDVSRERLVQIAAACGVGGDAILAAVGLPQTIDQAQ